MHLPALIGILYGLYVLIAWTLSWLFGKRLRIWMPGRWVVIGYIAFFLIWSVVLRNLTIEPFAWFNIPNLDGV